MRTALTPWRRSKIPAPTAAHTFHRPDEINWLHIALKLALGLILIGNLAGPFAASAQNLGTSPQFGQAVQGQQATTVEGTVLNIVNWGCNVIAPVIAVACLGIAGWHFKSGRGYMGWGVTGVALMVISGLGRMAEGFITQAQGIQYCFRRRASWFNSAGIKCAGRLRLCWVFPGHIRFNQTSGFQPEFPFRSIGKTFLCSGPNHLNGRTHLLFSNLLKVSEADCHLVTVNERSHGRISFRSPAWKSAGIRPISVSLRGLRYEAMLLMGADDWIETELGRWSVSRETPRLVLAEERAG